MEVRKDDEGGDSRLIISEDEKEAADVVFLHWLRS